MDFTKIRGKKTARFSAGDLVVCIEDREPYLGNGRGDPGWTYGMSETTGQVCRILDVSLDDGGYVLYLAIGSLTVVSHWYKPEWLIPAYDPENTLRLGEPVLYKYGKEVYLRTVKSIVGGYCELDNGSVFHHSKLYNLERAKAYVTWPALWRDCFKLDGSFNQELRARFNREVEVFNRHSVDNYY